MSRSCHRATFSRAAPRLPRSTRARPTICSHPIGLRLCGMADEPFWPLAKGSSTSPISVFWSPRISRANFSSDAAVIARAATQLRVPVALDDLRRHGRRLEPELRADRPLDRRIEVGVGADRAGDLAHRDAGARALHAGDVAADFLVPERQLPAERRGLGVHAVRAADHRRAAVFQGPGAHGRPQLVEALQHQVARVLHLERQRRVEHVRRGEAEVQPPRLGADMLGDGRREGDDVVPGDLLDGLDPRDVEGAPLADGARSLDRDDALLGHGLGGGDLDFEPGRVAVLVAPDPAHLRVRVSRNHDATCRSRPAKATPFTSPTTATDTGVRVSRSRATRTTSSSWTASMPASVSSSVKGSSK